MITIIAIIATIVLINIAITLGHISDWLRSLYFFLSEESNIQR